jgi:hypothetical protein
MLVLVDLRVLAQLELGASRYALIDTRWPESPDEKTLAPYGFTLMRPLVAASSPALQRFLLEQGDSVPSTGDARVERVAELVAHGRLRVVRCAVFRPALVLDSSADLVDISDLTEPVTELVPSEPEERLTHVAFRLVDDAGTPVARRGFSLTLPDGQTIEGVTDADGRFVVDSVSTPGTCELSVHAAA